MRLSTKVSLRLEGSSQNVTEVGTATAEQSVRGSEDNDLLKIRARCTGCLGGVPPRSLSLSLLSPCACTVVVAGLWQSSQVCVSVHRRYTHVKMVDLDMLRVPWT